MSGRSRKSKGSGVLGGLEGSKGSGSLDGPKGPWVLKGPESPGSTKGQGDIRSIGATILAISFKIAIELYRQKCF